MKPAKKAGVQRVRGAVRDARRVTLTDITLLSAVSLAVYALALRSDFVTDDTLQILRNPFITSFRYIPRLFATDVWAFARATTPSNYYRPLQMLIYMAEYHAFGFNPWPFHVVNLVVDIGAVLAVYFLIRALSERSMALWSALFFTLHPAHSEPVIWIAALPDLLCGMFICAAMLMYHRARNGTRPVHYTALATGAFLAGLFCKETAMTFPLVLLAYEFLYRRESLRNILIGWRRLAPYVCALGVYIVFRLRALGSFAPAAGNLHRLTLRQNVLSVTVLVGQYVLKLFWPVKLNYYYSFHPQNAIGWEFLASLLLIAILVGVMFLLRNKQPLISFGLAWFFCTLAPALSVENVSQMVFAERYVLLPSMGFCLVMAWAWLKLQQEWTRGPLLRVAYPVLAAVLAFWVIQIERRIPDWRDDLHLLQKTAALSPDLPVIQEGLGAAYYQAGQCDRAIEALQRSLAQGRVEYDVHLYLALSLAGLGQYNDANDHLRIAYQLTTAQRPWSVFGYAHASLGQWDRAIDCYRQAIEVEPRNQLFYELLGEALQERGDLPGAIAAWWEAIRLQPRYLDPSLNLAVALAQQQKTDEAIAVLMPALQAHPHDGHAADGYANLGTIYVHRGEWDAAEAAYEHALELNPNLGFARQALASIDTIRQHSQ